ncbi:AAEL012872-PA, partial [Aedes aegypti]
RIDTLIVSFVSENVQFLPEGDSYGHPISPPLYGLVKLYINHRCNNFSYLHYDERISNLLLQTSAQMPRAAFCLYLIRALTHINA